MKKLISSLFLFLLLISSFPSAAEEGGPDLSESILAPYYIVVDSSDPSIVFYEHDADARAIPGSTMKIMTCILILENCPDLEERVIISRKAANMKDSNSLMHVISGEDLSVRELLYGLMLESGNDAALTLAVYLDETVEAFAERMNAKAEELGMTNTHFLNASGAYKSGQYSTARDMATLACYAMQNETFRTIVSTPYYTVPPNQKRNKELKMINGNDLIVPNEKNRQYYPEAVGVKTGSTENGGKCLVSAATRNGQTAIAVLLGATEGGSKLQRMNRVFKDSARLLDMALSEQYSEFPIAQLPIELDLETEQGRLRYSLQADLKEDTIFLPNPILQQILSDPGILTVHADTGELSGKNAGDKAGRLQILLQDRVLFDGAFTVTDVEAPITPSPVPENTPLPEESPAASALPAEGHDSLKNPSASFLSSAAVKIIGAAVLILGTILSIFLIRKNRHNSYQ